MSCALGSADEESSRRAQSVLRAVPTTEADEILQLLFDMDITTHSLMPTLDNAAQATKYKIKLFRG